MTPDIFVMPLVLACAACILALKSRTASSRPRRLGMVSLALGLAGFIPAILAPNFQELNQKPILVFCGVLTFVFAISGMVFGIWSLRVPKTEAGRRYFAILGLVFAGLDLFSGVGAIGLGSGFFAPMNGKPWTWKSERYGFEVTVPSERWVLEPNPNVQAKFLSTRPNIMALIVPVMPAETDEQYEMAMGRGQEIKSGTPTINTDERTGTNQYGHPYWLYMGEVRNEKSNYFFGFSITRVEDKAVLLILEGPFRMQSGPGKVQEAAALRAQSELFLGSVK